METSEIITTYNNDKFRFGKEGIPKPTSKEIVRVLEVRSEHQIPIKIKMLEFEVKETEKEWIINMKYLEKNKKY